MFIKYGKYRGLVLRELSDSQLQDFIDTCYARNSMWAWACAKDEQEERERHPQRYEDRGADDKLLEATLELFGGEIVGPNLLDK